MKIIFKKCKFAYIKILIVIICAIMPYQAFTQSVEVKDNNQNTLIQINDEGNNGGSITIPDAVTISTGTTNKLYNLDGSLMWNDTEVGGTSSTNNEIHSLDAADGSPVDALYVNNDGNVGVGTLEPQGVMDLNSSSGALIVPRMTSSQRDGLPNVNGSIIYNSQTDEFNFYENGSWSGL